MRKTIGICSLALMSACGGSSSNTVTGPVQTATLERLEQYEDFLPSYSNDGSKGVFISQRDSGLAHVYLYDSSVADSPVKRFDDSLNLTPADGKEFLVGMSGNASWVAFSRVAVTGGASQVIVGHFSGSSQAKIDLATGHSINDLRFAKGSDEYFAYVDRESSIKTVKVVKISGDASAVTLEEVGSFANQDHPYLNFVNGKLQLVSASTDNALSQVLSVRNMDPQSPNTWTLTSDGSLTQSQYGSFFISKAGLITKQLLTATRTRKKLGSSEVQATAAAEIALIREEVKQSDIFQTALTFNFSAESYLSVEPLAISNISGSADGQVLLLSGVDSFACTKAALQISTQKLVRQSDSKVVSFMFGKKTTETAWNEVITNPCGVVDNTIDGIARQLDATTTRTDLVAMDGDFAIVSVESYTKGDRELRLARFKPNFDDGSVSEVTVKEISANPRP